MWQATHLSSAFEKLWIALNSLSCSRKLQGSLSSAAEKTEKSLQQALQQPQQSPLSNSPFAIGGAVPLKHAAASNGHAFK